MKKPNAARGHGVSRANRSVVAGPVSNDVVVASGSVARTAVLADVRAVVEEAVVTVRVLTGDVLVVDVWVLVVAV